MSEIGIRQLLTAALVAFEATVFAEIEYTRTEERAAMPGDRPRAVERTLIIPEWEPYSPAANMLHVWPDRPLFSDLSLRTQKDGYGGWFRDLEVLRDCGMDGFGSLCYEGIHMDQLRLLGKYPPPAGYSQMICVGGDYNEQSYPEVKRLVINAAKSPFTTRIDGKVLIWSYNGSCENRLKIAELLRNDPEVPPHIYISNMPMSEVYTAFPTKTGVTPEILAEQRRKIVEAHKVFGGCQFWATDFSADNLGFYGLRQSPTDVWRKYLLPINREELAKPENRGKPVGRYLNNGYINKFAGWAQCQQGTHSLRLNLDEIMPLNPDILVPFEWNEENESTHFQPTVAHGKTWTRILWYYRSLLDRTPPTPMKGDDPSVPNFIVSFRQAIRLGEVWHAELLYLPDGAREKTISAQLTLRNAAGKVLKRFPIENFRTDELLAVNYRVPSEQFAGEEVLSVELETTVEGVKRTWRGFDSTRIRTTACNDYLYAHHPLRELLEPTAAKLDVRELAGGEYELKATVEIPEGESLASVEILDDLEEIAADDPERIYDRDRFAVFHFKFDTPLADMFGGGTKQYRRGQLRLPGITGGDIINPLMNWGGFGILGHSGDEWEASICFGFYATCFDVLIPRGQLSQARLVLDFPIVGHGEVDLAKCHELGRIDLQLGGAVHMQAWRMDQLETLPKLLKTRSSEFVVRRFSRNPFPAFQLRAITTGGRIYRSELQLPRSHDQKKRRVTIHSDAQRRGVEVELPADAVPKLEYKFDPRYGALLKGSWSSAFDITLGGGGNYCDPMHYSTGKLPKDFLRADPVWVKDEGRQALRFDNGSYLVLPQLAIPDAAEYTLEFEIKPDESGSYALLHTRKAGNENCGLRLFVHNGVLHIGHRARCNPNEADFNTGLTIKAQEWNSVKLEKSLTEFVCTVNGQRKAFAYVGLDELIAGSVFGCNVRPAPKGIDEQSFQPFNGLLRTFTIEHAVNR